VATAVLSLLLVDGASVGSCRHLVVGGTVSCGDTGGDRRLALEGLALVAAGLSGLGALAVARRRTLTGAGVLFALAGLAVLGNPVNSLGVPRYRYDSLLVPVACAAFATAVGLAAAYWLARLYRRPAG
jgi:hypothetical protein